MRFSSSRSFSQTVQTLGGLFFDTTTIVRYSMSMKQKAPFDALMIAGLSDRETRIWHTLAEQGALNISQLAQATGLHRPAIYATLPMLKEKALIKEVAQGKRRLAYRITGVKALETWRASRDAVFAQQLKKIKAKDTVQDVSDDVRVYHGKEMRRVWEEVLAWGARGKVFYRYDGYPVGTRVGSYLPPGYYETIEKKNVDRFVITNQALRSAAYRKRVECASRMMPTSFDAFEQGVSQFIFGDQIALIDFTTETAFIVKNKALAAYHMRLFKFLFHLLPE